MRDAVSDYSEPGGPRDTARLPTYCTWKGGHTTRPVSGTTGPGEETRVVEEGAARVGRGGADTQEGTGSEQPSPSSVPPRGCASSPQPHTQEPLRRGGRASWLTGHPALVICPCRSKV